MLTAEQIIRILRLTPHPKEGGYFAETYRSREVIPAGSLPAPYNGARSAGTAIYYLLTPSSISAMHRLPGDELFHFYAGDPAEMLQLFPDGTGKTVRMGNNFDADTRPQVVVPGNVWQGSRLAPGGRFALLGATMSPGFDYGDYEDGSREALVERYPQFLEMIVSLTRE